MAKAVSKKNAKPKAKALPKAKVTLKAKAEAKLTRKEVEATIKAQAKASAKLAKMKAKQAQAKIDAKTIGTCKCVLNGKVSKFNFEKRNINTVWIRTTDVKTGRSRLVKRHEFRDKVEILKG